MKRGLTVLMLISIAIVIFYNGGNTVQAVDCSDTVCFSEDDTQSSYLENKIKKEETTYLGINFDFGSGAYGEFVEIGFKTEDILSRTWGGGSDFTWTFNSGTADPKFRFVDSGIQLLDGKLYVCNAPSENDPNASIYIDEISGVTNWGIYQKSAVDDNYIPGRTLMGTTDPFPEDPYDPIPLIVTQTGERGSLRASQHILNQTVGVNTDDYPLGLFAGLEYTADVFTSTALYTFNNTNLVTVPTLDDEINIGSKIKKSTDGDGFYKTIEAVTYVSPNYRITLNEAYSGSGTVTATILPISNKLGGLHGTIEFKGGGQVEGLRGIVGKAIVTGDGEVTGTAIGSRGVFSMEGPGNVGMGLSLATSSTVTDGHVDKLIGLGIEHSTISGGSVDELIGLGILPLELVDHGSRVGEYYGIKQIGSEQNYFQGYIDVNTQIGDQTADRVCYTAKSTILDNKTMSGDLIGFKYDTPILEADATGAGAFAIYLNQVSTQGLSGDCYGIYQAGNDANYLGGSLDVDGETTLNNTLDVTGDTTLSYLEVVTNAWLVALKVLGAVEFDSTLDVDGAVTFGSTFSVAGATTLNGVLNVDAITNLRQDVNMLGPCEIYGPLTIDNTSKVRYNRSSNQNIYTSSGMTPIDFDNEEYDIMDEWHTDRDIFTAENDGFYDVDASALFLATGSGDKLEIRIVKIDLSETETEYSYATDDGYYAASSPSTTDSITVSTSDKIQLLEGESIRVEVKVSTNKSISGGLSKTYVSIHRLS